MVTVPLDLADTKVENVVKTMKCALALVRHPEVRLQIGYHCSCSSRTIRQTRSLRRYMEQHGLSEAVDEHQDTRKQTFVRLAIAETTGAENDPNWPGSS